MMNDSNWKNVNIEFNTAWLQIWYCSWIEIGHFGCNFGGKIAACIVFLDMVKDANLLLLYIDTHHDVKSR